MKGAWPGQGRGNTLARHRWRCSRTTSKPTAMPSWRTTPAMRRRNLHEEAFGVSTFRQPRTCPTFKLRCRQTLAVEPILNAPAARVCRTWPTAGRGPRGSAALGPVGAHDWWLQ